MLLFNYFNRRTIYRSSNISIHLMLLFNFFLILLFSFPYYFNTSNVTIQLLEHLLNSIFSYHFNTSNVTIQLVLGVGKPYDIANFNTSNVTIQRRIYKVKWVQFIYFNTSNVTIQLLCHCYL